MRRFLSRTPATLALWAALPVVAGAQVAEVEPNNTLPEADAAPAFTGNVVISGAISPVGDVDFFRLNLATATVMHVESFDFTGKDCTPGVTASVRLVNAGGGEVYADNSHGIGTCGALSFAVAAGTYYIAVEETGNDATLPGYKLQLRVQAPAGTEAEPNDSPAGALTITGSEVYAVGRVDPISDADFYAITVPTGASIRAEVIEADPDAPCESFLMMPRLLLYDAVLTPLGGASMGSGRGNCALLDGTGGSPANTAAANLPGGTYFLAVRADIGLGPVPFGYRLLLRVVLPDLIFADDFEAEMAQVVINEFNANITNSCDLIELRVVSGGRMDGYSLFHRNNQVVAFSGLAVATNDLIVVHLDTADPLCNPTGALNETTSVTQFPSSAHGRNYDTAYDWYSSEPGLFSTDNVFTLYDDRGQIMDAVLAADDPTGTTAAASEAQAAVVAAAGEWQMVGGGVPPGGFVDDDFCAHAVLDLNATSTTASGMTIQRTTNVDSNDKEGWTTGAGAAQTWGLPNPGQAPF
jgi:hypothetical protein